MTHEDAQKLKPGALVRLHFRGGELTTDGSVAATSLHGVNVQWLGEGMDILSLRSPIWRSITVRK